MTKPNPEAKSNLTPLSDAEAVEIYGGAKDPKWRPGVDKGAASGVNEISKKNAETIRVGQWMSKSEYESFFKTGKIPRSNVLSNGKEGYIRQANIGDYYVEFDIDKSLIMLKDEKLGWWLVKSKNKTHLKLAEMQGIVLPEPLGKNIKHIFTKESM